MILPVVLGRMFGVGTVRCGVLMWGRGWGRLGCRGVWEGWQGSLWLGGWKVTAVWDLRMSCWAAWRAAVVRDHVSVCHGSGHQLGSSSRAQQPQSWLRGGGLWVWSMVGWYPGRAPKVENLKFLLRVSSSSPHPYCAPRLWRGWARMVRSTDTGARSLGSNPSSPTY